MLGGASVNALGHHPRSIPQENRWYALYTKPRHEKVVKRVLDEKGVENFLPLKRILSRWADRKVELLLPLFPGYVFARYSPIKDHYKVLTTRGIVTAVGTKQTPWPIPDYEITSLILASNCNLNIEQHAYLSAGRRVRITNGPLTGIRGILLSTRKKNRLILSVDLLQRSVAVEVDLLDAEPVEAEKLVA
jgi:transcription antitermination factor NusG